MRDRTRALAPLFLAAVLSIFTMLLVPSNSAAWPANGLRVSNLGGVFTPALAADGSGGFYVGWIESRAVPGGPTGTHMIVHHVRDSGDLDPDWGATGLAASLTLANMTHPALVPAPSGTVYAVWSDSAVNASSAVGKAIRLNADGLPSETWPAGGAPLNTVTQKRPIAISAVNDGSGNLIVAYTQDEANGHKVYRMKFDSDGNALWTTNTPLANTSGDQDEVVLTSDGAGGAVLAWVDKRNTGLGQVFAMRINSSGAAFAGWPANGLEVHTGTNIGATTPAIVRDASGGGAIIAWDGDGDIYAQHLTGAGARNWGGDIDGRQVCVSPGLQHDPALCTDGAGGAVFGWGDVRTGIADAYVQRLNSSGNPSWTVNGIQVVTVASAKYLNSMVSDGGTGAIALFQDARNGAILDLYAAHLNNAGQQLWDAAGVLVCGSRNVMLPAAIEDGSGGAAISWYDTRAGAVGFYGAKVNNAGNTGTTGIALGTVTANAGPLGVVLRWTATVEAATTFDVARGSSVDGPFETLATGITASPDAAYYRYIDGTAAAGREYIYRVRAVSGGVTWSTRILRVVTPALSYAIAIEGANPALGATQVRYTMAHSGRARVAVFDLSGRRVRSLVDGAVDEGRHSVAWDGRGDDGRAASSGAYFVRLETPGGAWSARLALLR